MGELAYPATIAVLVFAWVLMFARVKFLERELDRLENIIDHDVRRIEGLELRMNKIMLEGDWRPPRRDTKL